MKPVKLVELKKQLVKVMVMYMVEMDMPLHLQLTALLLQHMVHLHQLMDLLFLLQFLLHHEILIIALFMLHLLLHLLANNNPQVPHMEAMLHQNHHADSHVNSAVTQLPVHQNHAIIVVL
jgi:hypothetical protein